MQLTPLILAALSTVFAAPFAIQDVLAAPVLTPCQSSAGYPFTVSSMEFNPYPLVRGTNFSVVIGGSTTVPVTQGATIAITAKLFGISVYTSKKDMCQIAASQGQACPIAAGPNSFSLTDAIPNITPGGITVGVDVSVTNGDGSALLCLTGNMQVA